MNSRKNIARIVCGMAASIMLAVVFGSTISVKAAANRSTNSYNSAIAHQIAARTLKQCIENQMITNSKTRRWGDGIVKKNVENGDIFEQAHNVDTGSWFEVTIARDSNGDGSLECSDNSSSIVRAFADQFTGGDVSKVLCGANGTPGLVKSVSGFFQETTNSCGSNGQDYLLNENASDYVQKLYEQWLAESGDAVDALAWDELDKADFSDQELYYLVYNDLVTSCGVSGIDSGGARQINYVDENGRGQTKYMSSANAEKARLKTTYIDEDVSCNELADMLNDYAKKFLDTTTSDQGKICYEEWAGRIGGSSDQNTISEYEALREQATSSGNYSAFYDSQNDKCVDIGNEKGAEIEEAQSLQDIGDGMAVAANATGEDDGPCFDGGVGALGWIICPVVKFMRQGVTIMYDYIIRPFLEIDGQAFKMDGPAFAGWQIFQSFANIVFVIFLLVIIFSQITGVGIDNYGIKRMLPKLIVAAILVNLSYVICQLAVDASNIAGFAVDNLFQGMASDAMQVPGTQIPGVSSQAVGATIIAGTVGIGGAAAAIATAEIWVPAALLALIPALIGIIVSILFVFVILGARQAAAVILVVISPLALVMYMLPNTKKLFDRWLSAFKAVLLVFPICGLLMGGGAFAGALLWNISQDYFLGQLLAALMTVIPFFFIPRILKASMSAIGNIGNMISGAGSAIGRTLGGVGKAATKNSNLYNNMQARSSDTLEARNRRRERRRLEGIVNSTNGPGLSTEQKLRRAKALTALEKMEDEDDFASRPELITSEAVSKRFNRKVAAQRAALVANGTTGRIGDEGGFKNDDKSLAYALYNAASEEDRYAAVSELMAGGHHGEQALHEVIDALSQEAAAAEAADPENKDNAARRALESIAKAAKSDKNFGGLKGASRSTYDYINDIASGDDAMYKKDGSLRTMDDAVNAVNFNGMSQEGLVGTNTEELDRYAEALKSGQLDETQAASLVALASSALANERLQGKTKGKVGDALGRIAEFGQHGNHGGDNGGTGAVVAGHGGDSGSGTVLNVPRGNSGGVNPSVVGAAAAGGSGARSTGSTTTGAVVRGRSNVASSNSQSSRTRMPNASEVVRGRSNVASSNSQSSRTRMPNASEIDTTQSGQDQFADYNDGRGRDRR